MPKLRLGPWQNVALHQRYDHFAFYGGVATGKTYTGSHFCIMMIRAYPDLTGLIGANTYDQLSQATLRELFYWLDFYRFDYVIDCLPPREWGQPRKLKSYKNVLSVRNPRTGKVSTVFTRVMSDGNPLRGVEFSWYWLDETRDTPEDTHNTVIARMRESSIRKGLITTTTNGEDWSYQRFVRGNDGSGLYGSMHVPTRLSLEAGIITKEYYRTMLHSYSELVAAQELNAEHVNVAGGRAYYASGSWNKCHAAPWGDVIPTRDRPLIVGCDFNYQPAPCVWMVGQLGPPLWGPRGEYWGECIHWFGEVSNVAISTPDQTIALITRFPGFHYEIFGDASGAQGTTSNAGVTDYHQIGNTLADNNCTYSIDYFVEEDKANPRVKNRVENMNSLFKNALGQVRQTYNPAQCPLFDGDLRVVGWKPNVEGKGKLDNAGDTMRTHASDGAGYAVWKKFPPSRRAQILENIQSPLLGQVATVIGPA